MTCITRVGLTGPLGASMPGSQAALERGGDESLLGGAAVDLPGRDHLRRPAGRPVQRAVAIAFLAGADGGDEALKPGT